MGPERVGGEQKENEAAQSRGANDPREGLRQASRPHVSAARSRFYWTFAANDRPVKLYDFGMRLSWLSVLAAGCHALSSASGHGHVSKLARTIEFSNALSRVQTSLTLSLPRNALKLAVPAAIHGNLSHLTATKKDTKASLDIVKQFHDLKT
jgi:hypothetical protein